MALKRLNVEYNDLLQKPIPLCSAMPQDNFLEWKAEIIGPTDSPYEGGVFIVKINFPENYPSSPPTVRFETKIFHPNINSGGTICVTLWSKWLPTNTIKTVLLAIIGLMGQPNFDSCNWGQNSKHYKDNRKEFITTAKQWTRDYAKK